jgi:hypothetical protein
MDGPQEGSKQARDAFLKSRAGAILRCAEIMADSGRKDLARQILATTHIDRRRLLELKLQTSQSISG